MSRRIDYVKRIGPCINARDHILARPLPTTAAGASDVSDVLVGAVNVRFSDASYLHVCDDNLLGFLLPLRVAVTRLGNAFNDVCLGVLAGFLNLCKLPILGVSAAQASSWNPLPSQPH